MAVEGTLPTPITQATGKLLWILDQALKPAAVKIPTAQSIALAKSAFAAQHPTAQWQLSHDQATLVIFATPNTTPVVPNLAYEVSFIAHRQHQVSYPHFLWMRNLGKF